MSVGDVTVYRHCFCYSSCNEWNNAKYMRLQTRNYFAIKSYKLLTYNPGQNAWDTNAIARQIQAPSLPTPPPPPPTNTHTGVVLTLCIQALIQHNQHWYGERKTAEIAPYNNIPKLLQEVEYELIKQSASLCLIFQVFRDVLTRVVDLYTQTCSHYR